ncbi:MAG: hypothetical protein SFV15_00485 [Polyangiaceae bacterium]|nr:hypothetical protein [Polyangiaceae bacterium]
MTSRLIDALSVLLVLLALAAFAAGVYSLGAAQDVRALYLLVIGALALRSATDLLRPHGGPR